MAEWACEAGCWEFCGMAPTEYCIICKLYLCEEHFCEHE